MLTYAQMPDEKQISIQEIAAMLKPLRPQVTCFECDRVLIPRLGKKKAAHFGHKPRSNCDAASGEGQLHAEGKQHLRRELTQLIQESRSLHIHVPCHDCKSMVRIEICSFAPGDKVVLEKRHGDRLRPDVTVVRSGEAILFLEVVVTNPCDDAKWELVDRWQQPFAEVAAEEIVDLDDRSKDWKRDTPLPLKRRLRVPESTECDDCRAAREREEAEKQRRAREADAEQLRQAQAVAARTRGPSQPNVSFMPVWFPFGVPVIPAQQTQQVVAFAGCIHCRTRIDFDPQRPLCFNCWKDWRRQGEPQCLEPFCHGCAAASRVRFQYPLCDPCYDRLIRRKGRPPQARRGRG